MLVFASAAAKVRGVALSSTSTVEEARAQLRDNLDWRGSLSKARAFCQAFLWLEDAEPDVKTGEGLNVTARDGAMRDEYERARAFVDARSSASSSASGPRVTRLRPSPRFRG